MPSRPRYYCDVCDLYLTRDSEGGRRQHIYGYKHRENYEAISYFRHVQREAEQQLFQELSEMGFPEEEMYKHPEIMRKFPPPKI